MAIMRAIPGFDSLLAALVAAGTLGKLIGTRALGINRGYRGGGSGVGVLNNGRRATAPKPHIISKIERRKRQKQSIRDRKFRYNSL